MRYVWVKRHKLPILYIDPEPSVGPYLQLALGLMPRPVRWWPGNWLLLPICWLIGAGGHLRAVFASMKDPDNAA